MTSLLQQQPEIEAIPGLTPVVSKQLPPPPGSPTVTPQLPMAQPLPTSSAPSSVPTSQIGAENNLLSTQINPSAPTATAPSPVTAQANPQDSARFQNYSTGLDNALNQLTTGPDRTALAKQALEDFDTEGQPQLEAGYRRVGQLASKLGRIGSGMTTNDLTGLSATYQRDRGLRARGLARDVAEGDINDRFRRADAFSGARGQEYGFGADNRDYRTGLDKYNQGFNADYEDRLFGQRRAGENDLRGERDYQTNRADKALEDSVRQRMLEESLLDSSFDRSGKRLEYGEAGNPSGAYERAASGLSGEASDLMGAGGELIGQRAAQPSTGGLNYEALINAVLGRKAQTDSSVADKVALMNG